MTSVSVGQDIVQFFKVRRANQLINISMRDRYVFFKNNKVASSTVSATFNAVALRGLPKAVPVPHPSAEHSPHIKPYQLTATDLDAVLTSPSYRRFAFVRSPYDRLLSAYLDIILRGRPMKRNILNLLGMDPKDRSADISFDRFIGAVCDAPDSNLDPHWMPQMRTTFAHWVTHSFVGRLETFDSDLRDLFTHLDLPADRFLQVRAAHKTGAKSSDSTLWTPALKAKAAARYSADFAHFGYDPDV